MPQGNCFQPDFLHIFPSIQWWPKHMDAAKAYRNRAKLGCLMAKVMSNAARGSASSFFTLAFLDTGFNAFLSGRVWDDTKPVAPVAQHRWTCQDTWVFHIVSYCFNVRRYAWDFTIWSCRFSCPTKQSRCIHVYLEVLLCPLCNHQYDKLRTRALERGATAEMPVKMINRE